mgnify:FL=1
MWSIDLATRAVALVSSNFGLGLADTFPQLLVRNGKLLLIGKKVSECDPATGLFTEIPVTNWLAGGYQRVGGAYTNGKVYFRGWPYSGPSNGFPDAFQWNRLEIT